MIGQLKRIIELQNIDQSGEAKFTNNIIAFTSGKGGVGKTFLSLNLANLLSQKGKRVLFVDLDVNFSNAHILLNIVVQKNIKDFFEGKSLLKNVITSLKDNFDFLAGNSGVIEQFSLFSGIINSLFAELRKLSFEYDYIILDTGQVNSRQQIDILLNSDSVIIITTPEPTAIMDAYVIVKMLHHKHSGNARHIIINKCENIEEANTAFNNLNTATQHFLNENIHLLGYVEFDPRVQESIKSQKLYSAEYLKTPVFNQISELSSSLAEIVQMANINQF